MITRIHITICLIVLMILSCVRIDNANSMIPSSVIPSDYEVTSVRTDSEICTTARAYSHIELPDYWMDISSNRVITLLRRPQGMYRTYERREIAYTVFEVLSKVVLYSFIMILFSTGGIGLSMPIRCLLLYIHSEDGKKKVA